MAIDKETFDALPESVQASFEADDAGGYRTKAPEELTNAYERTKSKLKAFGDTSPEDIAKWKAAHEEQQKTLQDQEKDAEKLRTSFKKQLSDKDAEIKALKDRLSNQQIDQVASAAMDKAGILASARTLVGQDLRGKMTIENGEVVMKGDLASPAKALDAMRKDQPYLFESDRKGGSGATPPTTTAPKPNGNALTPEVADAFAAMDPAAKMKYLEDAAVARGER